MLSPTSGKLLIFECALLCFLAAPLFTLMFLPSYTLHFNQVTFNYYTNGKADFTADAGSLVRSLSTIAVLALVFGTALGGAIGLTYNSHLQPVQPEPEATDYEEELAEAGFVAVRRTDQGTTHALTDLGRRFLRDYSFLRQDEESMSKPLRGSCDSSEPSAK